MPSQESPLRKLPLLPGVEAEPRDSMNPTDIVRFWAPGAHVKDDVRSKIERTEEGILWKEATVQQTNVAQPSAVQRLTFRKPEHDHRFSNGEFHKLHGEIRRGFLVWMEQVEQGTFDQALEERWGNDAQYFPLGETLRFMHGTHPLLRKPRKTSVRESSHLSLEKLADLTNEIGWIKAAEYIPAKWDRLIIGMEHMHGERNMFLEWPEFCHPSLAKVFLEHQYEVDQLGSKVLKNVGPEHTWLCRETFPLQKKDWGASRGAEAEAEIIQRVLQHCPDEQFRALIQHPENLQQFLLSLFPGSPNAQNLGEAYDRFDSLIAHWRLSAKFSEAGNEDHILGDGRIGHARTNSQYRYVVPHTNIFHNIHENVPAGDVVLLPYGGDHFKSCTIDPVIDREGKYLEDFLQHLPQTALLVFKSRKSREVVDKYVYKK